MLSAHWLPILSGKRWNKETRVHGARRRKKGKAKGGCELCTIDFASCFVFRCFCLFALSPPLLLAQTQLHYTWNFIRLTYVMLLFDSAFIAFRSLWAWMWWNKLRLTLMAATLTVEICTQFCIRIQSVLFCTFLRIFFSNEIRVLGVITNGTGTNLGETCVDWMSLQPPSELTNGRERNA